ncbi:hypothetical protein TWF696_006118 [Orbilia brochopaga]|uniref:Uncharacterized protein n=1 Tax=Orbilia brochopaga TaxID=3140254 RepID=A0AAV9V1N9_9PEZI
MLRQLLDLGADPKVGGSVCLVRAAAAGDNDAASTFISRGADPVCQEGVPGKALQLAARNGHIKTCELLLKHGADVNAFGGQYGNALMATLKSYKDNMVTPMVKFLLRQGASVNSPPCEEGASALQLAISGGFNDLANVLLAEGADVHAYHPIHGTALAVAAQEESALPILKRLLEKGADTSLYGERCGTPLQEAARHHNNMAIELLLDYGANVNQIFVGHGGSALAAACRDDRGMPTIKLLLDRGADINLRGGKYETPLQYAAKEGYLEVVKFLVANGADPSIEGGKYGTAMRAAKAKNMYPVVNFLKRCMNEKKEGSQPVFDTAGSTV